jgi:hypothetical protein
MKRKMAGIVRRNGVRSNINAQSTNRHTPAQRGSLSQAGDGLRAHQRNTALDMVKAARTDAHSLAIETLDKRVNNKKCRARGKRSRDRRYGRTGIVATSGQIPTAINHREKATLPREMGRRVKMPRARISGINRLMITRTSIGAKKKDGLGISLSRAENELSGNPSTSNTTIANQCRHRVSRIRSLIVSSLRQADEHIL